MQVGNGPNLQMAPPLFRNPFHFCGSELPHNVSSTGSNLLLAFRTDGSVSHRGFRAHYTTEEPARKLLLRITQILERFFALLFFSFVIFMRFCFVFCFKNLNL